MPSRETDYAARCLPHRILPWTWLSNGAGILPRISGRRRFFDRVSFSPRQKAGRGSHGQGKKFAYVMTTGVEVLGPRLAEAGVDVLYFIDQPIPSRKGFPWLAPGSSSGAA